MRLFRKTLNLSVVLCASVMIPAVFFPLACSKKQSEPKKIKIGIVILTIDDSKDGFHPPIQSRSNSSVSSWPEVIDASHMATSSTKPRSKLDSSHAIWARA